MNKTVNVLLLLLPLPLLPNFRLTELDASHNQLSYVPSGMFSLPELISLCLSYNALVTLPGDPEDPSAQSNGMYDVLCFELKH